MKKKELKKLAFYYINRRYWLKLHDTHSYITVDESGDIFYTRLRRGNIFIRIQPRKIKTTY